MTDGDLPEPRFGVFAGQGHKDWAQARDDVLLAEELGFDHAWLVDHLTPTQGPVDPPMMEAWTLLAALAAVTSRIRLGVLVTNNLFRNPALLAKEAATVDAISGGRVILSLGTGWFADEHRRYGFDFPSARERVARLDEAAQVCRALLRGGRASFQGRYYRVEDAPIAPAPVHGSIPLLIAGHRPATIRIAARYADQWDTFPTIPGTATQNVRHDISAQVGRFERECRAAGRDPRTIRRSTWTGGEAAASSDSFLAWLAPFAALGFTDFVVGLPRERSRLRDVARALPNLRRDLYATRSSMTGPTASSPPST